MHTYIHTCTHTYIHTYKHTYIRIPRYWRTYKFDDNKCVASSWHVWPDRMYMRAIPCVCVYIHACHTYAYGFTSKQNSRNSTARMHICMCVYACTRTVLMCSERIVTTHANSVVCVRIGRTGTWAHANKVHIHMCVHTHIHLCTVLMSRQAWIRCICNIIHACFPRTSFHGCVATCVHVCVYVCIYVCMYVCMYVCIYWLHTPANNHAEKCTTHEYMLVYAHAHAHMHTHACLHICRPVEADVCIHMHTCTYAGPLRESSGWL
jgi:hypothetical protein